jgi:serpin B
MAKESERTTEEMKRYATRDPITLEIANRLFGQRGYDFRVEFLSLVKENYRAPFQTLDFKRDPTGAGALINRWVEEKSHQRIRDILPERSLDESNRLVLVNAIYLKAPWNEPFEIGATKPLPFHLLSGEDVEVPTMVAQRWFGYARQPGVTVLALPYAHHDLRCVIFLPDRNQGLPEVRLNEDMLAESRRLPTQELILYLPKFKIEPSLLRLGAILRELGLKSAFDKPPGSANFDRMAPRRKDEYLYLSEVFHKTFLSLDEKGTEAAAATALSMRAGGIASARPQPIEVHVDHPFIIAIQHAPSSACLFLGRVADPR